MKKALGILFLMMGFALAFIMKVGPTKETKFLFEYGIWPLLIVGLIFAIVGLVLYNKTK